jgi:Subtilase family
MRTRTRPTAALGPAAIAVAFALLCAPSLAAETSAPLPPSNYTFRAACPRPSLGQAECLALQLVPRTAHARSHMHPLAVPRSTAFAAPSAPSPVAAGEFGLRPQDLHRAYELPTGSPTAQTVAVVDAYNDLTAEADLNAYDKEFGLPQCNGCFTQVNQQGEAGNPPFPTSPQELQDARGGSPEQQEEAKEAEGWSVEISLDIETVRATCQSCKIVLVESDSTSDEDLFQAEQAAVSLGADEISNSWGGPECIEVGPVRECIEDSAVFDHTGVVITASAGDDGYLSWDSSHAGFAEFPASSPHVVAVGGTRLNRDEGAWSNETVWNDGGEDEEGVKDGYGAGGGGCSVQFIAQPWQQNVSDWPAVGCANRRAVGDIAADADPYTGFAVHDSSAACEGEYEQGHVIHVIHWCMIGGTSLASPLIASVFALAGGAHGVEYPARTLYENAVSSPGSLHDVTDGSNGECRQPFDEEDELGQSGCEVTEEAASCSSQAICLARTGYDGPTGVGTPNGIAAFQPPSGGNVSGEEDRAPGTGGNPPSPVAPIATTTTVAPGSVASAQSVRVTRLALTLGALISLNRSRPNMHQLGFTFTINTACRVRASLARRLRTNGHARWRVLRGSRTIAAAGGRNTGRLAGHASLSPGVYRLTLAPVRGVARSIVFTIG